MPQITRWTDTDAPRIFRSPNLNFTLDEPLQLETACPLSLLQGMASHGFNATWVRGKLYDLMDSTHLPELNNHKRDQRIAGLNALIGRCQQTDMGVYLFFNDPLALPEYHPFWKQHPELAGASHLEKHDGTPKVRMVSLCLSHPTAAAFFQQAVDSVIRDLPDLKGIILITASEHHSHCWSHYARFGLDDGFVFPATEPIECKRCVTREPAEIVSQIVKTWKTAANEHNPSCKIIAWNWSWSIWYTEPQCQVIDALPADIYIMGDYERGGSRPWRDKEIAVDEYSLGYAGPSARFEGTRDAARANKQKNIGVMAKLQIGTTHEVATVPNLPLLANLHGKLAGLYNQNIEGFMAMWNFGCSFTLNTYAVSHFLKNPQANLDAQVFLTTLAKDYFGINDAAGQHAMVTSWQLFAKAFEAYPFHIRMVYFSPVNDAPANPLSLHYRGQALQGTWLKHEMGDRVEDCIATFTLQEVAESFEVLASQWQDAIKGYERVLGKISPGVSQEQKQHAIDELHCAKMLAIQWRSAAHIFAFHTRRAQIMHDLKLQSPCTLPADEQLIDLMNAELANAANALPLVEADDRLGYHQEGQTYMYNPAMIRQKLNQMEAELAGI